MPADLAAMLVDRGTLDADAAERARARQREAGGALDTALLELGLVDDATLAAVLEAASGLRPAPPEPLEPDPRARRMFPARVAERHGLVPFRLQGRELSVVAAHPVDQAALDEIGFMLSLELAPFVAPEWRVRALLVQTYGGELADRFAALAARDAPAPAAAGVEVQAEVEVPPAPEAEPAPEAMLVAEAWTAPEEPQAPPEAAPLRPPGPPEPAAEEGSPAPDAPSAWPAPGEQAGSPPAEAVGEPSRRLPEQPPEDLPLTPPGDGAGAGEPPAGEWVAAEPAAAAPAVGAGAGDLEPPRWTREQAHAALDAAGSRDEVVRVALRYAHDFFAAAALFTISRDRVVGHDALGWEGARERCRAVQVAVGSAGLLGTALASSSPYLGPVARDPENEAFLVGLGRPWPRTALACPMAVRGRVVCVLYADNGDAPVSAGRLSDLLLFAGSVGGALDRILLEAKRRRAQEPSPVERDRPVRAAPAAEAPAPAAPAPASAATPPAVPESPAEPSPPPSAGAPAGPDASLPPFDLNADVEIDLAAEPPSVAWEEGPTVPRTPLVARLCEAPAGSAERAAALAEIARLGPAAAGELAAAFPGPVERDGPSVPAAERGPVLAGLATLGGVATAYLAPLLRHAEPGVRWLAAQLLTPLRDPASFLALAECALDAEPRAAEAALEALVAARTHPEFVAVLDHLRGALLSGDGRRSAQAALALGRLGDAEAIPLLVETLAGPGLASGGAAAALELLTCRRFGRDQPAWLAWWKAHRAERRADWIFDALADEDRNVREAAADVLRAAGPPPVTWHAGAPPSERITAAQRWRAWWEEQGRSL